MTTKTKLWSLALLGLIMIPAMLFPKPQGEVLGVSENTLKVQSQEKNQDLYNSISSGVKEVRKTENEQIQVYSGKAIFDEDQKVPVSTNKFSLGSSLTVENQKDEKINLVVNQVRQDLDPETLMYVDSNTFSKLGGNIQEKNWVLIKAKK